MCHKKKVANKQILLFKTKAFKIDEELKRWNLNASKLELENQEE